MKTNFGQRGLARVANLRTLAGSVSDADAKNQPFVLQPETVGPPWT